MSQLRADEKKKLISNTVNYILNGAAKFTPIKTADIIKNCLRNEKKHFDAIYSEAELVLANVC